MSEELRVEFKVSTGRRRAPRPEPGAKAKAQRLDRAARRARNLALAYWIEGLIRSGQVESLAAVARICGVSRSRVTQVMKLLGKSLAQCDQVLAPRAPRTDSAKPMCRI